MTASADHAPNEWTGKVAVVTGAGAGIGRATALTLARCGAPVACLDIDEDAAQQTAGAVRAAGVDATAVRCDTGSVDEIRASFIAVDVELGACQVLVNNAAVGSHTSPLEISETEWSRVLAVGLTGYVFAAQQAVLRMIAGGQGGVVVNLSSIAGSSALGRGNFAYSIAKGGVNQLTRELAVEVAAHGIRVNAIQPCQVTTPALRALIEDPRFESTELTRTFLSGIPMGRFAEPEEIAVAVRFLASDAARFITGVLLPVDGGNLALNAGGTVGTVRPA